MLEVLTPEQLQERWGFLTRATIDTWRARDKKRIRQGLPPAGPKWIEINPKGSGRPIIRYRMEDILAYESANKIMVGGADDTKLAQGTASPATNP